MEGNCPSRAQPGAERQRGGALHDGAVESGVARCGAIGSSAGRDNQVRGITKRRVQCGWVRKPEGRSRREWRGALRAPAL